MCGMKLQFSLATLLALTAALAADTAVCSMVEVRPPTLVPPSPRNTGTGTIQLKTIDPFVVFFPRRPNAIEFFWRLAWSWPLTLFVTVIVLWTVRRPKGQANSRQTCELAGRSEFAGKVPTKRNSV
jgi:hypothetical protein